MMRKTVALLCFLASCGRAPERFDTGPIDLGQWTAVNYRLARSSQEYARWVVDPDGRSVTQTVNADPSIFLSDRNLDRQTVEGTWLVADLTDDDLIGFVFGYRDPGHFYVFDWKQAAQQGAERGMSVKIVDVPYVGTALGRLAPGQPFEASELWNTTGVAGKTRLIHHEDTLGWEVSRPYTFRLDFGQGRFRILVKDGAKTLYDRTHLDSTYRSGRFGFYNYSQRSVIYKGFEARALPGNPAILQWLAIVIGGLAFVLIVTIFAKRRRARAQAGS